MVSLAKDLKLALDRVSFARALGLEPDPWQEDFLRSISERVLLNCCRQSGKSTMTGIIALHRALYHPGSLILCLAPALRQSQELFAKVLGFYRDLDRPIAARAERKLSLELENGSRIVTLPGTEKTIRGFSGAALLIVDEASRVADELYFAVRPMLAVSGGSLMMLLRGVEPGPRLGSLRGTSVFVPEDPHFLPRGGAQGTSGARLPPGVRVLLRGRGGCGVLLRRRRRRDNRRGHAALWGGEIVFHYYIGLDLGQSSDYTALALIEEPVWLGKETDWSYFNVYWPERVEAGGWVSSSELGPRYAHNALAVNFNYGRPANPPLYLRHLERYELGTKYDEVIKRVRALLLREPIRRRLRHTALLVDKTGVGAAVVDHFWAAGVRPLCVSIHGGAKVIPEPPEVHGFRVPKRDLVSAVQVLLQNGRLKVAKGLQLAPVLKKELLNFRVKIDPQTAHDSYEHWREGDHDDLVLATALACWYRQYVNAEIEARNVRRGGFSVRGSKHSTLGEAELAR